MSSWADVVAPLVAKCEVAENFGTAVSFNKVGAAALRELLLAMAGTLDRAVLIARPAPAPEMVELIYQSVRFAEWAAGEGICPGEDAESPEEFLLRYAQATDAPDCEDLAAAVREALGGQPEEAGGLRTMSDRPDIPRSADCIATALFLALRTGHLAKIGIDEIRAAVAGFLVGCPRTLTKNEAEQLVEVTLRKTIQKVG